MKFVLALIAVAAFSWAAAAQHSHGSKGPNGGLMEDAAGVHAELLTSGNTITVNIFNESGAPLSTKTYTGSVLVVSGTKRETVSLVSSGDGALKGEAKGPVAANATITLMIKTDTGKTGQARFKK